MKSVFLHSLGQSAAGWDKTIKKTVLQSECICPELSEYGASYPALYSGVSDLCGTFSEKVNLCGLSLGGILALNYTLDCPDKVNSLVLIGAQYKMPKALLRLQNLIFRLMPSGSSNDMGFKKADFISLSKSMMDLDFSAELEEITCPAMVIVGESDKPNRRAAEEMSRKIRGCKFEVIKNSGHEVNVDAPERLAELLNDFYNAEDKCAT